MRLIKVYSNKESFKTVKFNESGLSFIVAKQKNPHSSEKGQTYNGVGKSLLVRIIHFCLGSSMKNYKSFCEKLPGWEFYLDFFINNQLYCVKRATDNPNKIILNNEEFTIDKFNQKMQMLCFTVPNELAYLSFRSLIPFFIRPNKESYVSYDKPSKTGNQYQVQLYNAFLLGLDVFLAQKKYNFKKEQDRIKLLEKNFRNDSLLRDFLTGNKDVNLTLIDLEEQIQKLDDNLFKYKVAEDYYDVQVSADRIEKELFTLNNKIILMLNNIEQIEESLQIEPSMNRQEIEAIYNDANVFFPERLSKTLDQLEDFYENMITNRKKRLIEQRNKIIIDKVSYEEKAKSLKQELDKLIGYLGEHQALDLFVALNKKSADLKTQRDNLLKYQELQGEYKDQERYLEREQLELTEVTENYLRLIENEVIGIRDFFRSLAKKFYPNCAAGLAIDNNDGQNQLRYNIEAKIESDSSDGINNVKIFCYDLTLLFKGSNHNIDFIFHDSRLFDGIDERQKADLFRIISEVFSDNKQYIATVNQNQLDEIKRHLTPDEIEQLINRNIILNLTDESSDGKLLGITIDIGFN